MNPNGPNPTPDLRTLLDMHRDEIFASINCIQVGQIAKFSAGVAQVKIAMRRVVYNQAQGLDAGLPQQPNLVPYPLLINCPCFALSGGAASITMPIAVGDPCLLLFNDRDTAAWFSTGTTDSQPETARMHDLSDGFALVGFRNLANALMWSATDVLMQQTGAGKWNMQNGTTSLRGLFDALVTILGLLNAACGSPATTQIAALATAEAALLS